MERDDHRFNTKDVYGESKTVRWIKMPHAQVTNCLFSKPEYDSGKLVMLLRPEFSDTYIKYINST